MAANQNPPAPNMMDPANQLGLYNPNAYVRGAAAEAIGKRNGVMRLRKAASEGGGPTDRIKASTVDAIGRSVATGSIRSYSPPDLSYEEDAAFDDMIDENADRTVAGAEEEEEEEGDETVAGVESEGTEPVAGGAAAVEKEKKDATAGVAEAGKKTAADAADASTVQEAGEEEKKTAGVEKDGKKPAESQQKKKKKVCNRPLQEHFTWPLTP